MATMRKRGAAQWEARISGSDHSVNKICLQEDHI